MRRVLIVAAWDCSGRMRQRAQGEPVMDGEDYTPTDRRLAVGPTIFLRAAYVGGPL